MKFAIRVVQEAEADLAQIHRYVASRDSMERADRMLVGLEKAILKLETMPGRGHVPPELERVGLRDFREIHVGPLRVIYEIRGKDVFVHCVLDGRRDLRDLLYDRLLH